jgi:lipid-A-disaccharide synthase
MVLPIMLKAAQFINKTIPQTQFIIAKTPNLNNEIYSNEYKKFNLDIKIIDGLTYDCLNNADASIVCSGTATLEAAITQKPFVVVYKTNIFNYLLYRPQIKIPYIGMVNIVAGKEIVEEFVQFRAKPKLIANSMLKFLQNPDCSNRLSQKLQEVKNSLGQPKAAQRAAKLILEFLSNKNPNKE